MGWGGATKVKRAKEQRAGRIMEDWVRLCLAGSLLSHSKLVSEFGGGATTVLSLAVGSKWVHTTSDTGSICHLGDGDDEDDE